MNRTQLRSITFFNQMSIGNAKKSTRRSAKQDRLHSQPNLYHPGGCHRWPEQDRLHSQLDFNRKWKEISLEELRAGSGAFSIKLQLMSKGKQLRELRARSAALSTMLQSNILENFIQYFVFITCLGFLNFDEPTPYDFICFFSFLAFADLGY